MWSWELFWDSFSALLPGLWITFAATVCGALLAYVLGLVFALIRQVRVPVLSQITFGLVEFIRSTPLLVQIFFFYWVVQPWMGVQWSAFWSGTIALGLHYACYTSEVYRAGIDAVPKGQWEASTALSLPRRRTWTGVILPQAIPRVLPALGNYTISMFKETPLLLAIGVIDIVGAAKDFGADHYSVEEAYTMAGIFFLVLSFPSSILVRRLERRFVKH
ncbi:polar amino acid transport system permease protein [Herbihabitans rhizosphaerae]|uniref:Polar amino acid transport system permease protein n=1 Tax=Herbihabitans rhizosphaerae TaxID=1872711 RepID=A0A4Q7KER5_9PSEU|nr:ectoine/hydroxyectoine ABC transporter permease subunit EhuD [Herbihabitans rhizosphaerae]RZS32440.1 polar amino acid transport system permease protein [Herbihabitans rhizosphaerae]